MRVGGRRRRVEEWESSRVQELKSSEKQRKRFNAEDTESAAYPEKKKKEKEEKTRSGEKEDYGIRA